MPIVHRAERRGQSNQYDTAAVIDWLIARSISKAGGSPDSSLDLTTERARLASEQADKTALDNALTRGDLVSAANVQIVWVRLAAEVKTRLLALPTRLAPLVTGCTRVPDSEAILREGVHDVLSGLADGGEGVLRDAAATRTVDGEPVGGPAAQT